MTTTYTVLRWSTNVDSDKYKLIDDFPGTEVDNIKYYLIQMSDFDVTIYFKFDTYILSNTLVDFFEVPTVSDEGRLLTGSDPIVMHADPTVTDEGNLFYEADSDSTFIDVYTVDFLADTTYLVKIIPKDLNDIVIS